MSAPMKKHPIKSKTHAGVLMVHHAGIVYKIPEKVAQKYIDQEETTISPSVIFAAVNKKYTKPGALLRGLRVRENLTQIEMAEKLHVTQSDISQMESGTRAIGRTIAQRIEKLFDVDYRSFLS